MNKKALKTLEFYKIIEQLTALADSPMGKEACETTLPLTDIAEINKALLETSDALGRVYRQGAPSFRGAMDIRPAFLRLKVGSVLSIKELMQVSQVLGCTDSAISYNNKFETEDSLTDIFNELYSIPGIKRDIDRCIISEDEISDDASPGLKQIRRTIKNTNDKIHEQLSSILNSSRSMLQDALITMRNGRYCLPVKAESKSSFPGMVHDQSSTGSTLFIEPMAVVKLNNELKELEIKEHEEIEKVLAHLSNLVSFDSDAILNNLSILINLDYIFAKAKLAKSMKATMPRFNTNGYINLKQARHPLIEGKKVVPIDVYIGDSFRHLIITGPNTGGKTVTLKTVGLFTLLGQAGLLIPALDNSELSVFNEVLADIGDEQSIEQSLSTFSAHMTNIVEILKLADKNSLVLFDELGAGTDPEEGAALAISILSYLLKNNVTALATTHYSELKLYALSTDNVENASCEFDVNSLRPTYHLLIGIPGKSNAFAISKKLGLPDHIINDADSRIDSDNRRFEDVLGDIEASRIAIEKQQAEIDRAKKEVTDLRKKLKEKNDRIDRAKEKIIRRANEEARDILQAAKDEADEAIRQLNKQMRTLGSTSELEKTRSGLGKKLADKDSALAEKKSKSNKHKKVNAQKLKIGDEIHVISLGLDGTITSLPDAKGMLNVQMGILSSSVHISDITLNSNSSGNSSKEESKVTTSGYKLSKASHISPELNLIGQKVIDAISLLDKYLDDAYLSHLSQVTIIHGRGTGALRNAIHAHLKNVSYVKSYRIGEYGEGDHGVTIVEFK
ncbi:MAG: endonuclease MutS2 [Lachnospiraceae bacterium]|nr:endonuclease MutS2 [Lachnospiraceae bacterium]